MALSQWKQRYYSCLRLILGRNLFKVIRLLQHLGVINAFRVSLILTCTRGAVELKYNRACLSNYLVPRHIQDRSYTVYRKCIV